MTANSAQQEAFVDFFRAAIEQGVLNRVPIMKDPDGPPKKAIVVACGQASYVPDRVPHLHQRVTDFTHLINANAGGFVLDPEYRSRNTECGAIHAGTVAQIFQFMEMALCHGLLARGDELTVFSFYDYHCLVVEELGYSPVEFVRASIRAKNHLRSFRNLPVRLTVSNLYYLAPPITPIKPLTFHAPRCALAPFADKYVRTMDAARTAAV